MCSGVATRDRVGEMAHKGGGGWWGLDGGGMVPMEGNRTLSCAVSLTHHKGKIGNYFKEVFTITDIDKINITKYS